MKKTITIAIDGYSGSGKSSTARSIADILHLAHLDTGKLYRAITLYFLREKIDIMSTSAIKKALQTVDLSLLQTPDNKYTLVLNGEEVNHQLQSKEVNDYVSEIAAIPNVRAFLLNLQRTLGEKDNIVIDGRDIGTHVFPNAEVKFFLSTDIAKRVERRYKELQNNGIEMSRQEIEQNFIKRDKIDSNRTVNPLKNAEDAIMIDTSLLTFEGQVNKIIDIIKSKINYESHD